MKVKQILFQKSLCCYPPEEEAAKLFHKFLLDHPEHNIDEIKCKIDSVEREEDYYGNGGGYDNTLTIYTYRNETKEELEKRIKEKENMIINKVWEDFNKALFSLDKYCKDLEIESIRRIYDKITENLDYYFKNHCIDNEKIKIV